MAKFWKAINWALDWLMNLIFAIILFGGGAWCIWNMFIK